MALALAVLSASVPFAAPADRGQSSPDEIICDLVHPWPFNHAHRAPADTDGDGVADKLDRCPGTPRHATVDANGCPMDADGDGVADGLDRCPDTPRGAVVSASGCPKDSDDDGVADGLDRCDDTPRGAVVDARGCPSDADKDGVVDGVDECPDTPMEYAVNKKGCPIPVSETYQEFLDSKSVNVYIQFGSGKADILPASEADLNRVGEVLAGWPEAKVEVGGHTDSQGAEKFNETLSKQRAESVKSWLTSHYSKINSRNLVTKGYGESKPIAPNDTPEGMAQNRRVTFTLLNADELGKEVETRRYKKRGE
jgi:OOP family OmpA-OmpF porin